MLSTAGASGKFLELHDSTQQLWQKERDFGWVSILVPHGPTGFLAAGSTDAKEAWLGLHDADGMAEWEHLHASEATMPSANIWDAVVTPEGGIVATGFVSVDCARGSSGG